ncbi:MAG: energy-coupling factor transporter transmembrane protein EcfT [Desulfamplus sp.]|nr:energy-coupling factor transporter transmembrane protein EcfT [Desulfamplus sp.]
MGKVTPLSYRYDSFVLFQIDVRCKIICIFFLSIVIANAHFLQLYLITAIFSWLLYRSGFNIRRLIRELKYFFIIVIFLFIIRTITASSSHISIPIFGFINEFKYIEIDSVKIDLIGILNYINANILTHIPIDKDGLTDGCQVSWRFFLIVIMGILFSSSTTASAIKSAVMWFLKPFPFIPKKRVAVMVSLFVRFLPLLLEKATEVSDAQKARCFHLRKNPVKKIKNITVPLITKVFNSADNLAIAMASRCYNENRTEIAEHNLLRPSGYEINFYLGTIALVLITLFI